MDTLHARADWESLGEKWFRRTQQYTAVFDQDLDLDNHVIAGAPYAGALGKSRSHLCAWKKNETRLFHVTRRKRRIITGIHQGEGNSNE